MIHVMPPVVTGTEAWVRAARHLFEQPKHDAYNLILDIQQPVRMTQQDFKVARLVDVFLKEHGQYPVSTVAGTIFPAGFYRRRGAQGVYKDYPAIYARIKDGWGRYALRMLRYPDGKGGFINPLQRIVSKVKQQVDSARPFKAVYEMILLDPVLDLATYEPAQDANRLRQNPCLSYLSFKLLPGDKLMLTVFYRYHYYVSKTLGNLIGLGQLLGFVCREAGVEPAGLVCHSTYAMLDDGGNWKIREVAGLIEACESLLQPIAA